MTEDITLEKVKAAYAANGFSTNTGEYELNTFGIRSGDDDHNDFRDKIGVFYTDDNGKECFYIFNGTTVPGIVSLEKPINPGGCAILAKGQYKKVWRKGLHKNTYPALVQAGTFKVYRDNNKDGKLDFTNLQDAPPFCSIELHHAADDHTSIQNNNWSAGCQVIANPVEHRDIMQLVDVSLSIRPDNFDYTLFDEADITTV